MDSSKCRYRHSWTLKRIPVPPCMSVITYFPVIPRLFLSPHILKFHIHSIQQAGRTRIESLRYSQAFQAARSSRPVPRYIFPTKTNVPSLILKADTQSIFSGHNQYSIRVFQYTKKADLDLSTPCEFLLTSKILLGTVSDDYRNYHPHCSQCVLDSSRQVSSTGLLVFLSFRSFIHTCATYTASASTPQDSQARYDFNPISL